MVWVPQANPQIHSLSIPGPSPGVFAIDLPINSMVNFHSYVCLPGGNCVYIYTHMYIIVHNIYIHNRAPKIAKLVYKWLNNGFMVDITIVNDGYNGL